MENLYLYKDKDGNIQRATAGEPITREYIKKEFDNAARVLRQWTDALDVYDKLAGKKPDTSKDKTKTELEGIDHGDGHITFTDVKAPTI